MWYYEKRLQFPVNIKKTCPKTASLIISQYGGPDGELSASLRYLSQRYTMPLKSVGGLLTDIGTEELGHLEMIGAIVYLKLSYPAVESRLRDIRGRGVVLRDGQTLLDLYQERAVLYERYADVTVEEDGLGVEETLEKTLQALEMLIE